MNKWDCIVICTFIVSLFVCLPVVSFFARSTQQESVRESIRCTRCQVACDKSSMKAYTSEGKTDILICPKCVYDQAASFLKFCPMEE